MFGNYVGTCTRISGGKLIFSPNPLFGSWREIRKRIEEGIHIPCRLVWLGVIESREWKFRDRSLQISYLFCENGSSGGKGKDSLESQLPLINFLGEGWKLDGSYILNQRKVDPHRPS